MELALYVFSQAVECFYNQWSARGLLPRIKHFDSFLFCGSTAVVMAAYINKPSLMRPSYFSMFRFLFGSGTSVCASVCACDHMCACLCVCL
jgi:hypothetical protein